MENMSWRKRRTLSLAVKSSQLKPLANKLTALIGPMKQARDVIVSVLDTVGEGNFRKSKALRNAVTGLINVEDDLDEAASALNAGQVNNTELSLAREANDPDIKKLNAAANECFQLQSKLVVLSHSFDDIEDSDAAEYIAKAAAFCNQAKKTLQQAISELGSSLSLAKVSYQKIPKVPGTPFTAKVKNLNTNKYETIKLVEVIGSARLNRSVPRFIASYGDEIRRFIGSFSLPKGARVFREVK